MIQGTEQRDASHPALNSGSPREGEEAQAAREPAAGPKCRRVAEVSPGENGVASEGRG